MNIIQQIEAEQIARLTANRKVPDFAAGDTLREKPSCRPARDLAIF
jgi:ribosomal protein L19